MMNFYLSAIFITLVCAAQAYQPGPESCGCFNFVYIDKPLKIEECFPKAKFLNQIHENYNNIRLALLINNIPYGCDFTEYKQRINGMKERTIQMVETYFSCTDADCAPAVMAAYQKYADYRTNQFNPFTLCSFTNFNQDCTQVLIQARPAVYASAENILVGLLACSKLKTESHWDYIQSRTASSFLFVPKNNRTECNCVKVDPRPIPKDECECFSRKFIATIRKFIENNFGTIFNEYNSNNSTICDYTEFYDYVKKLKGVALEVTTLLDKPNPKLSELKEYFAKYYATLVPYSRAVRAYILKNQKSCYSHVRKARQGPLLITDAVIGILFKCVRYRDCSEKSCPKFFANTN